MFSSQGPSSVGEKLREDEWLGVWVDSPLTGWVEIGTVGCGGRGLALKALEPTQSSDLVAKPWSNRSQQSRP